MLKRIMSIIISAIFIFSMTACGENQDANEGVNDNAVKVSSKEFSTEFCPVFAAEDTFIVKDETTERYGLIDGKGKEIMPCEFGDMYYLTVNLLSPKRYVAVQDKGSYGIYDLDGNVIIEPIYDGIVENTDYTDSFVVENDDIYGVVDITGAEIVPLQYRAIGTSPKGILAGLKLDNNNYTVDVYSASGTLQNSFPIDLEQGLWSSYMGGSGSTRFEISFNNWGSSIYISMDILSRRYELTYDLNGTIQKFGRRVFKDVGESGYFFYVNGTNMSVINGKTGEEIVSTTLSSELTTISIESLKKDAATGSILGFVTVSTYPAEKANTSGNSHYRSIKSEYYVVNISENPKITLLDRELWLSSSHTSPFYENSAFSEDKDYNVYIVNGDGEITEFNAPYSNKLGHKLLENCAVLNNNGYVYVTDKEGNTILSEEGYTKYQFTANNRSDGLIALTAPDGSVQVIDSYGNEIVPLGNDYSVAALFDSEEEESEEYSIIYDATEDKYIFVENESHHVMETNKKMDSKFAEQLLNGQGWIIWNESAKTLFAVVPNENEYQVCSVASIV